ncbi:MAG: flagella basal body P-ring formation protein FlgA [Terracidiphilus sp.]
MICRNSILPWVLLAAAALPAWAGRGRFAITADEVAAALSNHGLQISPQQVVLLTGALASVAAPELQVKSVDRAGDQRAVARLECADSGQCLPFVVALHLSQSENTEPLPASSQRPARANAPNRRSSFAVRAGSHATLLLDGAHVHINLTVICLQNGAPGQIIRATDLNRSQVYTVQVAEDGVLEGRL